VRVPGPRPSPGTCWRGQSRTITHRTNTSGQIHEVEV
jgi:hypothetical protein